MLLENSFPNFNPEDYIAEIDLFADQQKVVWTPDKAAIDEVLLQSGFVLSLPVIHYSTPPELKRVLRANSLTFKDELVNKYEVFTDEKGVTLIRVFTQEHPPFRVELDKDHGIVGPSDMLELYTTSMPSLDLQVDSCYTNNDVNGLTLLNEQPQRGLSKTTTFDSSESKPN